MSNWYQSSLLTVEVVEARIRLGLVPERDHAQVMVEIVDPVTGVLVGQWSRPHGGIVEWHSMLDEAVQHVNEYLAEAINPF